MTRGRTLYRIAALVCDSNALERIVEPAIADLQRDALALPVRGYLAVLAVIVICAFDVSRTTNEERQAATRTLMWAAALSVAFAALLTLPPLFSVPEAKGARAALLLVPQAVPLAIPIGLAFAIAGVMSLRATLGAVRVILIAACLVSLVNFALMAWGIPAANQAWRESVAGALRSNADAPVVVEKGPSELTLSELRQETRDAVQHGEASRGRLYSWTFHLRFALSLAAVAVAGVLLAVPIDGRVFRVLAVLITCFAYWLLLSFGEHTARRGYMWPVAAAWLPNCVLMMAATVMVRLKPDTTY
jgi:hypothetical protein